MPPAETPPCDLFPAWFISSVTARGLREAVGICRLQTRGPACSPTSWKGTVRHRPEGLRSRAPHGQSHERATSPDVHVGVCPPHTLIPPHPPNTPLIPPSLPTPPYNPSVLCRHSLVEQTVRHRPEHQEQTCGKGEEAVRGGAAPPHPGVSPLPPSGRR